MASATQEDAKKMANGKEKELEASKASVMAAYDNLLEAKEHFKHAIEAAGLDLRHEAGEQWVKGKDKAQELGQQANTYVHERPIASLGMAFAAGFILAQLLGSRR